MRSTSTRFASTPGAAPDPPAGAGAGADPTLAALVPAATRRRNVALVTAAVLALGAAWFSPRVLGPALDDGGWGGSADVGTADRTVAVTLTSTPLVWPWATVTAVDDAPGATVLGAWLMPADDARRALEDGGAPAAEPGPRTGRQALGGAYPVDRLEATALPQRLRTGEEATLAILWRIDDCGALDPAHEPVVRVRTVLGTPATTTIDATFGPAGDMTADLPRDAGVCP